MSTPLDNYLTHFDARIIPLRRRKHIGDAGAKRALAKGWRTKDYTRKQLVDYWSKGHALGWALGPEDLVIDVDAPTKDRPNKRGIESLAKLNNLLGKPLEDVAVEVVAPSGGRHYYLRKPPGLKLRKNLEDFPDIDFKSAGGYVVIAGSEHWQGGSYRFSAMTEMIGDYARPQCPKVLLDMLRRDEAIEKTQSAGISGDLLAQILGHLDAVSYRDHADWFPIFCAAHHATGGSAEGFESFAAWSTTDPQYAGHEDKIRDRWKTLEASGDGAVTIATLYAELIDLGLDDVVAMVKASIDLESIEGAVEGETPIEKPKIEYTKDDLAVNDLIIAEIAKTPNIFQRSEFLVTIRDGGIKPLGALEICEQVSSICELGNTTWNDKKQEEQWKQVRVPERVGRMISAKGSWFGVRRLSAVTSIPVMTSEGVLQTPGYDPLSAVFYSKSIDVPKVKSKPTKDDARAAADLLFDLVQDFPFLAVEHRSAWLAGLLAIIARPAIDGPCPMTFIDGNQAGAGKGLLTDLIYLALYGDKMPKATGAPTNETEMQKMLLSVARQNPTCLNFDNLPNGYQLGSPALDSVLTSSCVTGRILGRSEMGVYPIDTVMFGSGNRISLNKNSDMLRRLNYINLQSVEERPEDRMDFRHGGADQLQRYTAERRPQLIHAALTILEYARQSPTDPKLKPWGSYESFSRVVRRAIVLIGEPDPITTRDLLIDRDESRGELEMVLKTFEALGANDPASALSSSELLDRIDSDDFDEEPDPLLKQAVTILAPRGFNNRSMCCGKRLSSKYRDQVCGGRWLRSAKESHTKVTRYWVEPLGKVK